MLVDQAVSADGAQNLRVCQRLQNRVAFEFVKGKDARRDPVPCAARQIEVGRPVEKTCPRSRSGAESSDLISEFERDLQFIRNGGFTYVWLISRKDGKPLEPADNIFLKANAPQVVDWVTTDGKKKVFAGTNFNLEEGNLEVLKRRYNVEDYSGK